MTDRILIPTKRCAQCVFADFSSADSRRGVGVGECHHPVAGISGVSTIRSRGVHGKCPLRSGPTVVHLDLSEAERGIGLDSSQSVEALGRALDGLQTQALVARELLQAALAQREGKKFPTTERRKLRARLRAAQALMASHRAECAFIVRAARCFGLTVPEMTLELLAATAGATTQDAGATDHDATTRSR
jgi:hypothetical protein